MNNTTRKLECQHCGAETIEKDTNSHELYCISCGNLYLTIHHNIFK